MSVPISPEQAEKKAFRSIFNDGLWDILLACFISMMAVAPLLSSRLGDFWSSAVFLPFWGLAYLAVWLIRRNVVAPRVGVVRFGRARKARLARFTVVMLVVNVGALILGFVAAANVGRVPGQMISSVFGLILLVGFSTAAFFLDLGRLYVYGLLLGLSPFAGEWLFSRGYASHHGFPVTFGTTAVIMIVTGLVVFARLLRDNPVPVDGPPEEA
jgi:hypothetical protein